MKVSILLKFAFPFFLLTEKCAIYGIKCNIFGGFDRKASKSKKDFLIKSLNNLFILLSVICICICMVQINNPLNIQYLVAVSFKNIR